MSRLPSGSAIIVLPVKGCQKELSLKSRGCGVLRLANFSCLFEFKLGTAEKALEQIQDKKYYEKYLSSDKQVVLVGVGFDVKEKNIHRYIVQSIEG